MENALTDATVILKCESAKTTLNNHLRLLNVSDSESIKLQANYFDWVSLKTKLIEQETTYTLPLQAIPGKISEFDYNWLRPDKRNIFDKYYKQDCESSSYVLNAKKQDIPNKDKDLIVQTIRLKRGNVVWVEFGFNIGNEFGGKHPAIILKNNKDSFLVIPLSSQAPNNPSLNIQIDKILMLS